MNRIENKLNQLKASNKKMLSPYITAGDPNPSLTVSLMHALVEGGADIVEVGIPFSDPMAEGPVIAKAMERALAHDVNTQSVLNMVKEFRQEDNETPVIIMGYLNPIEQFGYEAFAKACKECGVDGTILVDLPPEESKEVSAIWNQHDLTSIYLCSPTTSDERMQTINALGNGYLYYVSLKGVTGSDALNIEALKASYLKRKTQSTLPLMVGFGIKNAETAGLVSSFADGVIVGAALVSQILEAYSANKDPLTAASNLMKAMRDAMDNIEK